MFLGIGPRQVPRRLRFLVSEVPLYCGQISRIWRTKDRGSILPEALGSYWTSSASGATEVHMIGLEKGDWVLL